MKKVIIAFDGANFSKGSFEFAQKLNEIKPILLIGVFLPHQAYPYAWAISESAGGIYSPALEDPESNLHHHIEEFERLCQLNGIDYRIHKDASDIAIIELKNESSYADLMIIGSQTFYKNIDTKIPNNYLKEVLTDILCPVILVPEEFIFPKSNIIAYDGTEDSVYAIKQFVYLFPEFINNKTILVYANENRNNDFPNKIEIEELVSRHFNNLTLLKINDDPKSFFKNWVFEKNSSILISGSFGRSPISRLFKKSFVKRLISEHQIPIFLAHR